MQVLTRGPVHEAFAEVISFETLPGTVIPKSPPPALEELPPSQTLEGDNIAWIPGYWAWDDERNDFLWVSGIWRALPPGRQWVPGYWSEVTRGVQWTSGYWADGNAEEVEYLPAPPATAEVGPNIAAPSAEHIWAPGCWVWNQSRYMWRPGYWLPAQQDWVWVPAHYTFSPQGYTFVDGYYDHTLDTRGILFAPVYFSSDVYAQRGFSYSPSMAINLAAFASQLFLRPNYSHYYYGDYYGSTYSTAGYYPTFSFNARGHGHDPFYAHQYWRNRQNKDWANSVQADYQYRAEHENARPPRTLAAQQALRMGTDASNLRNSVVAAPLEELALVQDNAWQFRTVTRQEQQKFVEDGLQLNEFSKARQRLEAKASLSPATHSKSSRLTLPISPLKATSIREIGNSPNLPQRPNVPSPGPKFEPNPRQASTEDESSRRERIMPNPGPKPSVTDNGSDAIKRQLNSGRKEVPKAEPNAEPRPTPKAEPKPAPRVEPKPAPRVEPKPAPRVEPKPSPRVEPKPSPRAEPKRAPKVEPKPAPQV